MSKTDYKHRLRAIVGQSAYGHYVVILVDERRDGYSVDTDIAYYKNETDAINHAGQINDALSGNANSVRNAAIAFLDWWDPKIKQHRFLGVEGNELLHKLRRLVIPGIPEESPTPVGKSGFTAIRKLILEDPNDHRHHHHHHAAVRPSARICQQFVRTPRLRSRGNAAKAVSARGKTLGHRSVEDISCAP